MVVGLRRVGGGYEHTRGPPRRNLQRADLAPYLSSGPKKGSAGGKGGGHGEGGLIALVRAVPAKTWHLLFRRESIPGAAEPCTLGFSPSPSRVQGPSQDRGASRPRVDPGWWSRVRAFARAFRAGLALLAVSERSPVTDEQLFQLFCLIDEVVPGVPPKP
jgi:hypothetical protein